MRRKWTLVFVLSATIACAGYVGQVLATPAEGFEAATLALGRFAGIDTCSRQPPDDSESVWLSCQKTVGASELHVQSNVLAPGGTSGWHTHPGHSLIIVTDGTVTAYEADDPDCTPHVYTQGMGFVDEGGDHVHMLRNETAQAAKTIAVQLIPAGAMRRIDAVAPSSCRFVP